MKPEQFTILRGAVREPRRFRHIAEIESKMGSLERKVLMLDKKLADWKVQA